jgi:hypothetical protein
VSTTDSPSHIPTVFGFGPGVAKCEQHAYPTAAAFLSCTLEIIDLIPAGKVLHVPPPHTHAHTHTHTRARTRAHTRARARAHAHARAHTRTRTHIPTRARARAHTHTHTHTRGIWMCWRQGCCSTASSLKAKMMPITML